MKILISFMLMVAVVSPALALERFDIVTTQELKQLLDERADGKRDFCLMNTLDTIIFEHSSIPGSINIPMARAQELAKERLGSDIDRLIVSYCMGYR